MPDEPSISPTSPILPPNSADPISFSFEVSENDLYEYCLNHFETDTESKASLGKYRRTFRWLLALAGGGSIAFVMIAAGTARDNDLQPLSFFVGFGGAALCVLWYFAAQYYKAVQPEYKTGHARAFAQSKRAHGMCGPQSMSISSTGIAVSTQHYDGLQRWSGITSIRETKDSIMIVRVDEMAHVIPKRFLSTPSDSKELVARVRAWLDAAGYGDGPRIRAFLAQRDVPCRGCRYNLRGVTAPACPECGRELARDW